MNKTNSVHLSFYQRSTAFIYFMRKIITSVTLKAIFYIISSTSVDLFQPCSTGSILPIQALSGRSIRWHVVHVLFYSLLQNVARHVCKEQRRQWLSVQADSQISIQLNFLFCFLYLVHFLLFAPQNRNIIYPTYICDDFSRMRLFKDFFQL